MTEPGPLVLLVEDEDATRTALDRHLTARGYRVDEANDVRSALARWEARRPDLIMLDLGLPDRDGTDLIRRVRREAETPILVLSARDAEQTKVEALELGADDYVTKPFGADELLARVRAALRRSGAATEPASLEVGDFRIDLDARRVHVGGREVRLTPKEFDLFVYLARHPNRVLTHPTLLEAVWGEASQEQPEYLRVFMGQLRKKLETDPSNPRYLVTEPWVGYRFNPAG